MFWAIGMILMARNPVKLGPIATAGWQQLFGFVGFMLMVWLTGEKWNNPSVEAWSAAGYLVVAGSLLAITSLMAVLRLLPATLVSTYAFVNPVVAVFLGWLILSEPVTWYTLLGAALVFAGVAGVFDDRRHRQKRALTKIEQTKTLHGG
jgi:drug/metabolite transporter (DMT)-like permease